MPIFTLAAAVGARLPLFVVTTASQNLPEVAAQRAAGIDTPVSPVLTTIGVASLLLPPFGGSALNLAAITAAITAAICLGREAHKDPARRWAPSAAGWPRPCTTSASASQREPALITFLVTFSGLSLWGVGVAFWGVVGGVLALAVQRWRAG